MNSTWSTRVLSLVLLMALLLPAGETPQAGAPTSPAEFDCGNVTEIPQAECEALVALYESTDGDNWTDSTGWLETSTPCSWYGVACSTVPFRGTNVARLELAENQLSGSIPSQIGHLTYLEELDLFNNQLSGEIPPEIGDLHSLSILDLPDNQLSGSLPPEIGDLTSLQVLSLFNNRFSGPIPPKIGNLSSVSILLLSNNRFSGPIPPQIGNLAYVQILSLANNQFSGAIPSEIAGLGTLWNLNLSGNLLTSVPQEMGTLTAMQYLTLANNPLSGELPAYMTSLTNLVSFSFYDTEWCVPPTGPIPDWLSNLANVYGTGFICGESLGSLSGNVVLTDTSPAAGVQVTLYRSTSWPRWQHITSTHTSADGTYQFTDLGQGLGVDYRVQFVDPDHQMAPQYYDGKSTIEAATVITITPSVPRTGIDAVLALPQPPVAAVDTDTGSVVYGPDGTAQITMPTSEVSDITVTGAVTCTAGAPTDVSLILSTGPTYPMSNIGGDLHRVTVPAADLNGSPTLSIQATCGDTTTETTVAHLTLYDPRGRITDATTGQPVADALVTLHYVPDWEPRTDPDDTRPNTCESTLSKDPDAPWSQPAPTHLGIIANADVTPMDPFLPYQETTVHGYYGWDVGEGCWYVTAEAEGYQQLVSPVVGVPPEVADLDLALAPVAEDGSAIYLPLVLQHH